MNENIHPKELKGTGLAPGDFEIIAGYYSPELAREKGWHPADEWREERHLMPHEQ